jgi:hypothetical protein
MATLGDEPGQTRSTTLRPPGAIPPPPRAIPAPNFDLTPSRARDEEPATRRQKPTPASALRDTVREARTPGPSSALPSELRPAVVIADLDATLGSTPFEVTAQDFVDIIPPSTTLESSATAASSDSKTMPPARKRDARQKKRPAWLGVVVLATAVGLTVFALVKLFTKSRTSTAGGRATAPVATPGATTPDLPTTPAPTGCGIVQPAARLAATAHRPVTPLLTAPADGTRASIGFAESETEAVGLAVDLVTLDVERVFRESKKQPVRFVVPLALDPKRFVVDRDKGDGPLARSVDSEQRFGIAPLDKDWVRVTGATTGVLWSGQAADETTDPRVASSATGHLVTFRRGGLPGQVLYGFLGPDGSARGELRVVDAPGVRFSGTPDAALAGTTFVVAFAGRATQEDQWGIVLASGKTDGGPATVRTFTSPPGGAGGSSIAPSVSGLGDDGFVLQWTEGKSAEYQVRVQRLSADLTPMGEPALVSPKGANAGQGAVFVRAPRAISVFVQTTAGHDELWGTSLECP